MSLADRRAYALAAAALGASIGAAAPALAAQQPGGQADRAVGQHHLRTVRTGNDVGHQRCTVLIRTSTGGNRLRQRLAKQGLALALSSDAKEYLGNQGYDPTYGARPLKRAIQHHLLDPLSMAVLDGKFIDGDVIEVGFLNNELTFTKS